MLKYLNNRGNKWHRSMSVSFVAQTMQHVSWTGTLGIEHCEMRMFVWWHKKITMNKELSCQEQLQKFQILPKPDYRLASGAVSAKVNAEIGTLVDSSSCPSYRLQLWHLMWSVADVVGDKQGNFGDGLLTFSRTERLLLCYLNKCMKFTNVDSTPRSWWGFNSTERKREEKVQRERERERSGLNVSG